MSILLETDSGWIISHGKFFTRLKVKEETHSSDATAQAQDTLNNGDITGESGNGFKYYELNSKLFEITHPFKDSLGRECAGKSPTQLQSEFTETTKLVKQLTDELLSHPESKKVFIIDSNANAEEKEIKSAHNERDKNDVINFHWPRNNRTAVTTCQRFFEEVKDIRWGQFHGQNPDTELSVISEVNGCSSKNPGSRHSFIFPSASRFYCNEVSEMESVFQSLENEEKFDLIIVDPPWWNKFIRRKKRKQHEAGYEMISNAQIAAIPIKDILKDDGMVVVWCTNAKSIQDALLSEIFPAWGVHFHKHLYWLKVTKSGIPICPFNIENKKQPYETIIIGTREMLSSNATSSNENLPKVLVSVPSSINSHKPPLIEILKRLYPHKNLQRNLEVFARYLLPGFTSYGNEVLKLQHLSIFEKLTTE